ncbi:MAG: DUF6065 family protein [Isosphaeraceae bacterium]
MTEHPGSQCNETEAPPCSRCRALEARIAALEAQLAARSDADARTAIEATSRGESQTDTNPVAVAETHASPVAKPSSSPPINLPRLEFKALRLIPYGWGEGWQLRPSPPRRHWMDELTHSYQCLPLVIANQWGWQVLCPTDVRVTWDGTPGLDGLRVEVPPQFEPAIKSQFGSGIVTFSPPWLFRTPPGWDLYLKGPSNRWKPNCSPLEGVIETWWLNYTFTINWKLVEPGTVVFARGESLGQLVPVPHATFEDATAIEAPIGLLEPDAARELVQWLERRRQIAGQKVNVHHLYRKAEGIEEHLQRVAVPAIKSIIP